MLRAFLWHFGDAVWQTPVRMALAARMADEVKSGKIWHDDELDVIVADYFAMLDAELAGQHYVKAHHNKKVMARIGRSHFSVELKHGNISAVLEALGLPWIKGYRPMANYQKAIFPAIERYLMKHPEVLTPVVAEPMVLPVSSMDQVFVGAPPLVEMKKSANQDLRRLVRKFDPAVRDEQNRRLGKAGEAFAMSVERERLRAAGRSDLVKKVRWVAEEEGDGAGYDVRSYEAVSGEERLLEVKTTNGSARTPFFLTRNEREVAEERPREWRIYRVHLFAMVKERRIFEIAPPLEKVLCLRAELWKAGFVSWG